MHSLERILLIEPNVDRQQATDCLKTMTADEQAAFERRVFYPYHRFEADCQVPTLYGREGVSITCLVDGINGLAATTDAFVTSRQEVPGDEMMAMTVNNDAAHRAAYSMLIHQMSKRLKTMASFDIFLAKRGIVYKSFWIIRGHGVLFMVDSMTGGVHPLKAVAA